MSIARLTAAVAALVFTQAAHAGVVIEGKDDDGKTQRFLMDGQKIRVETAGGNEAMVFDGATRRSVQLDVANKTYTEFTKEDMAKMQEMVKRAKPQQARARKYEKSGKTDQALGKSCDVYKVVESGGSAGTASEDDEEMCLAPFGTFGVQRADFDAFRSFGEFASQLSGGELERSWADLPGVPLIAWETDEGQRKETFRATKVEKRSIPASEFAVPAGFKREPGFAEQMKQYEQQAKPKGAK